MNLDFIIQAALIGGIFAIVFTLIYVGYQLKKSNVPPAPPRQDKRNHAVLGFRKLLLSDPSYVYIWRQGQAEKPLDEVNQIIYNQLFFEYWHAQQEGYLRAKEADDEWSIERARETVIADHRNLAEVINRLRVGHMLHPDYDLFLNETIKEIERASGH